MKKLVWVPCMALALALTACQTTVDSSIEKLSRFIDQVEQKSAEYSAEDWEKANEQFEELIDRLDEFKDITPEQAQEIARQQGRYAGIALKNGTDELLEGVGKSIEEAGKVLDGFLEGLGEDDDKE